MMLDFGSSRQQLIISTALLSNTIMWPGIPPEHAMPFTNVDYVDDLFTWAEINEPDDDNPEFDDEIDDQDSVAQAEDVEEPKDDEELFAAE